MSSSASPRRRFTPEFKAEAVSMVDAPGGNIAAGAKELGIAESTIGNWVRRAREEAAGPPTAEEPGGDPRVGSGGTRTGSVGKSSRLLLGAVTDRVTAVYAFIAEEKSDPTCPSVGQMCRVLEVSRSGFYDWEARTVESMIDGFEAAWAFVGGVFKFKVVIPEYVPRNIFGLLFPLGLCGHDRSQAAGAGVNDWGALLAGT